MRAARAILLESSLEAAILCESSLEGVGRYDSEDRRIFSDLRRIFFIRERVVHLSKANEYARAYKIINRKVDDDHRSWAENPLTHAL